MQEIKPKSLSQQIQTLIDWNCVSIYYHAESGNYYLVCETSEYETYLASTNITQKVVASLIESYKNQPLNNVFVLKGNTVYSKEHMQKMEITRMIKQI